MISPKLYRWLMCIMLASYVCSFGLQIWLYLARGVRESGILVLSQFAPAVIFARNYRRDLRKLEQAKADAMLQAWRPPPRKLDW